MGFNNGLNFQYFQRLGSNDDRKKKKVKKVKKKNNIKQTNLPVVPVIGRSEARCWYRVGPHTVLAVGTVRVKTLDLFPRLFNCRVQSLSTGEVVLVA